MKPGSELVATPGDLRETPSPGVSSPRSSRAIFHPVVDFLCLGGASLVVLPVALFVPETRIPAVAALMLILADGMNNPHFAVSYHLFYRGIIGKLFDGQLSRGLRARYIIAGIVVPIALAAFFAFAFLTADVRLLGWGGNLMSLLVGWHYTKQGYGMLMVDSVVQRRFFNDSEKSILRYNAYACWQVVWIFGNWFVHEKNMLGLKYYSVPIPLWILYISGAIAVVFTILTIGIFVRRYMHDGGQVPVNGTMSYFTTLYVWLIAGFHPVWILVVPFFHSLQYMLIVCRFEFNRNQVLLGVSESSKRRQVVRFVNFAIGAVLLGLAGFWWAPELLQYGITYDKGVMGGTVFMFMFWIFINVHHYFIDNVIWRRDNPDAGKYLFGVK